MTRGSTAFGDGDVGLLASEFALIIDTSRRRVGVAASSASLVVRGLCGNHPKKRLDSPETEAGEALCFLDLAVGSWCESQYPVVFKSTPGALGIVANRYQA